MYRYLLFFTILAVGCAENSSLADSADQSEIPRVVKSVIATSSTMVEKSFVALSTPVSEVNLAFKVAGQILSIPVITGEEVAEGEVIAQIDPRDLELIVAADKSSYEQAKSRYDRAVRLFQHEAISKQEVESAESSFARAKSTYENSLDLLEQSSLQAPFDAVIERVYVKDFQRVQAGESIVRLVSPTTNEVSFTLPENSLSSIKEKSTTFRVSFDNYPGELFDAQVSEYARSSSDASGFPVTLKFENPDPSKFYINSGLSCTVVISTPEQDAVGVTLPLSAIYAPTKGGTYVWVIGSGNRVELHEVTLGSPIGQGSVIVESGVKSGDDVVVAGVYQLRDNQLVKIIK